MTKNIINITFEKPQSGVYKVSIKDSRKDVLIQDTLRVDDNYYVNPAAREAMTHYGFWLYLKSLIGDSKPQVVCNNVQLLFSLYAEYCKDIILNSPEEHWPFSISGSKSF